MLTWREEFESHIPEMDREHKKCFDLGDLLLYAIDTRQGREQIIMIFNDLVGNIVNHFVAEELLMKDYSYPLLAEHENEHKQFIEHIESIKNEIANNETELTKDIIINIQNACSRHVLKSDHQFVTFFNERSNKKN